MHNGPMDLIALHDGDILTVHDAWRCQGQDCCIHSPSPHPLINAPLRWRGHVMERVCEHNIGHPDPDDLNWRGRVGLPVYAIHGCDGCCWGRPREARVAA